MFPFASRWSKTKTSEQEKKRNKEREIQFFPNTTEIGWLLIMNLNVGKIVAIKATKDEIRFGTKTCLNTRKKRTNKLSSSSLSCVMKESRQPKYRLNFSFIWHNYYEANSHFTMHGISVMNRRGKTLNVCMLVAGIYTDSSRPYIIH